MLAYRLIHEQGKSVKEAAYAAGYQDPFYFSRVFKRTLGIPPSQVDCSSGRPPPIAVD